jgi:hypothetical protein
VGVFILQGLISIPWFYFVVFAEEIGETQHRGKTSAHASTLLKSVLRTWCQVFQMLSKTQIDVLPFLWKCKRNNERDNLKTRNNYSLHVQEVVLCKKINQRWLSINILYKTFFKLTEPYRGVRHGWNLVHPTQKSTEIKPEIKKSREKLVNFEIRNH